MNGFSNTSINMNESANTTTSKPILLISCEGDEEKRILLGLEYVADGESRAQFITHQRQKI